VHLKTVTLIAADCSFDFMLATADALEPAEADFDAWWASFTLPETFEADEAARSGEKGSSGDKGSG
jgi:hypothetical protein